jgi:hypothetical protein
LFETYLILSIFFFSQQVPFPIQDIYLRMPTDDDEVTELNSSQLPTSQEESTVPPSSPDVSTPSKKKKKPSTPDGTPRRSKRLSSPIDSTPRRSKRVSNPTNSSTRRSPRQKKRKHLDTATVETADTDSSDDSSSTKEVISIVDNVFEIQEEKEFVKTTKRKTKKGQSSPVWTYDYFRVAELIDGWKEKKIGKFPNYTFFAVFNI